LRLRHADVCLLVVIAFACHLCMVPNIAAPGTKSYARHTSPPICLLKDASRPWTGAAQIEVICAADLPGRDRPGQPGGLFPLPAAAAWGVRRDPRSAPHRRASGGTWGRALGWHRARWTRSMSPAGGSCLPISSTPTCWPSSRA